MLGIIVSNNLKALAVHLCMCAVCVFIDISSLGGIIQFFLPIAVFMVYFFAGSKLLKITESNVANALSIISIIIVLIPSVIVGIAVNSIFLLLLVSPMMVLCLPIVIILDLVMSDGYLGFIMAMLAGVLLAFLGMWAGMTFRRGKDIAESS